MFKISNPTAHYGESSYPLHGLPGRYNEVKSVDSINPNDLSLAVGRITGFAREFNITHHNKMSFNMEQHGVDLTIPERIVALADGYTITWVKA